MNNDYARSSNDRNHASIDEHGFAAILRGEHIALDQPGIIGSPRVNPTGMGLWIEDAHPAAIDDVVIAILEDFVRRENIDNHFELTDRGGSGYRDSKRHASLDDRRRLRVGAA